MAAQAYGRAALNASDEEFRGLGVIALAAVDKILGSAVVKPSLLHGDLWIGNAGIA